MPVMISYRVRRLHAAGEMARRYHLFDRADQLLLVADQGSAWPVSYTHLRAHETVLDLVCRLLLEKKNTFHSVLSLI